MLYFFLCFLCYAFPAFAQSVELPEIVVTSSRLSQNGYKLASNVTVIDAATIKQSNASTVVGLLAQQVGVNIYDNGTPKTATVDIRGFGDTANRNVLVLVNDRKVNPVDISGPDLLQIPLDTVERIEIIRGIGTVLYGDNATGGVVNIITKEGKGKLSAKLGATYGSFDSRSSNVQVSGATHDTSYFIYSSYADQRGYRQNSDVLNNDFQSRLSRRVSDWLRLGINASWHRDEYGLPGGLRSSQIEQFSRRWSRNPGDKAFTKDRAVQGTLELSPLNEELGRMVVDVSYRDRDTYADFQSQSIATMRDSNTLGVGAKHIFDKQILGHEVNFVGGIDYYHSDQDILGSGFSTDDLTITKRELGLYLSSEFELYNNIFMTGGTRYQRAQYTFNVKSSPQAYLKQDPDEQVSMVGLKYEYAPNSNIYANVQETFRFLATDEWHDTFNGLNTALKQQTGRQFEVGVKHSIKDITTVHVTPYITKLRNEIFVDPSAGGGFGANSNYDRTLRKGVEVGQTTHLMKFLPTMNHVDRLDLSTSYNYKDPTFDGGAYDGKQIPMVARHQANGVITLGIFENYNISLIGTYVGSRYAINDTNNVTSPLKGYFTLDSKILYTHDPFELFVSINNIFEQKYYSTAVKSTTSNNKDLFPAPERSFVMGVSVKF